MSNVPGSPVEAERQRLGTASTLARLALIGVALAAMIGTFAYFGGWFALKDLTPARFNDAFRVRRWSLLRLPSAIEAASTDQTG